jgi:dolichol-phosphate mannosyltransferase
MHRHPSDAPGTDQWPGTPHTGGSATPAQITVVVPTFNERDNVSECVRRLHHALDGHAWEVIFVDDDSPDGTSSAARDIARRDPRVRVLQRIGRRGLSRAVIEGILASAAPVIAVMDGDLQHDEGVLPQMIERLTTGNVDVVVGTRYGRGGSVGAWDARRVGMSKVATRLSRLVVSEDLSDPLSGFFVMKRDAFDRVVRRLSGEGFKILLDLFASSPVPLAFDEVPYEFRLRVAGESKLDAAVAWQYVMLIAGRLLGGRLPPRLLLFSMVGSTGVAVHLAVVGVLHAVLDMRFVTAQALATWVAMTSNFALNNVLTYRDSRLTGRRLWTGLASFYVVCGVGAVANVGVAGLIFARSDAWLLAGLSGVAVGTLWNYVASSRLTWGRGTGL